MQIIDDSGARASHFIDIDLIYRYSFPAVGMRIGCIRGNFKSNRGNDGNAENNDC
jgi:hypothetical protein